MKNIKKAIALVLCLITVFSVMSITASAASISASLGYNEAENSVDWAQYTNGKVRRSSSTTVNEVKWMQSALNYCLVKEGLAGKFSRLTVDGSFGPKAKEATIAFQKATGLTADGSFGPATIKKIKSVLNDGKDNTLRPKIVATVTRPTTSTTTTQKQTSVVNKTGIKPTVYSQLKDYTAFNYPGGSGSTYSSSGCGVYSVVNAIQYLTGKKIDPHELGKFAINNGARINGGVVGQTLCKKAASNSQFGGKYGFYLSETYTFGSSSRKMTCSIGGTKTSYNYPSVDEWEQIYKKLVTHLQKGDVAVVLVLGHYMAIVDYDVTTNKFLMLDSAAYTAKRLTANSGTYQWVTADQLNYNKAKRLIPPITIKDHTFT